MIANDYMKKEKVSIEVDPDYALGNYNLALTRLAQNRPREAIQPLQEALRVTGDRLETLTALGEAAGMIREHAAALDAFDRALKLDEQHHAALLGAAKMLGALGRYPEAKDRFEAVLALHPQDEEARAGLQLVMRLLSRGQDATNR